MRIIVVGLGVQGQKRSAIAGADVVATVDPVHPGAQFRRVEDVPVTSYEAALVCTPDSVKIGLLRYLLSEGKHVLVEKPLLADRSDDLIEVAALARRRRVTCYTAYNHRFEPHFVRMKEVIDSGALGEIYCARMFYGNGTARLVRESVWRDQGAGVLPDLGSHLLDTVLFWFGTPRTRFRVFSAERFENRAFDHVCFGGNGRPTLQLEVTLLSWRNHFYADLLAEKGSAHIRSLCKWGPSSFVLRHRKLPSGRPDEQVTTLTQSDPTWALEYTYFKDLCARGEGNLANDVWIGDVLSELAARSAEIGDPA
jgi:scyllo-inositol 2-dehydrogenase (NADP+)